MSGQAAETPRFEPAAGAARESELTWLSTRALASRIASGKVSAREALTDHLARIDAVDPALNAIVTRDDEAAYAAAAAADESFSRGDRLGPLHGVPMTHKDTHDTAGLLTTYGSPLLAQNVPVRDSLIKIGRASCRERV